MKNYVLSVSPRVGNETNVRTRRPTRVYRGRVLSSALAAAGLLVAATALHATVPTRAALVMDEFSEAPLRGQTDGGFASVAPVSAKNVKPQPWTSRPTAAAGPTTVTNNADSGAGSLRAALDYANLFCYGGSTIDFAIPTGGPASDYVISPATALPPITCPNTIIDGYTQSPATQNTNPLASGFNGVIAITLTGSSLSTPDSGLTISADFVTIKGLSLTHFDNSCTQSPPYKAGIFISSGAKAVVAGNLIGVDVNGGGLGNCNGITMNGGTDATIGGTAPGDRNIISANYNAAVELSGATGPSVSAISGNFIGVAPNRSTALANGGNNAIWLDVSNTVVDGNYIAYNLGNGVGISSSGVIVTNNEIAGNFQTGVAILGTECSPQGVSVRYNSIYAPAYLGIDLGGIGIPAGDNNNVRDTNGVVNNCYHGNGGQNFPVISAVTHDFHGATGLTKLTFQLDSAPSSAYMLDVYDNSGTALDTANQGIGKKYISSTGPFVTDGTGSTGKQTVNFSGVVQHPTMTSSTDPYSSSSGGTSEFSVQAPTPLTFLTTLYLNYSITTGGSMSQTFSFRNDDASAVNVPVPTFDSPEFTVTSAPCGTVAAGATCAVTVAFSTASAGTFPATMTVGPLSSSAAPNPPVLTQSTQTITVALSGTATAGVPALSISGNGSFPNTAVGASSAVQTVTITNTGSANLLLNSLAVDIASIFVDTTGGPSPSATHWCGFGSTIAGDPLAGSPITIAPGASCTLNLVFKPSAVIGYSATLTINSNAATSPNTVALSGTGLSTVPTYAPASLDFGSLVVGVTSSPQTATFTNTSAATVSLTNISFNGGGAGFNILSSSQCLTTPPLAPGASCTIDITATPNAVGPLSDSVYVGTSPAVIAVPANLMLTVTGIAAVPSIKLSNLGPLDFGTVTVNSVGPAQTLTITNNGNTGLYIGNLGISGDFSYTTNCPIESPAIPPAGSCSILISFGPLTLGSRTGAMTIFDNAPGNPHVINLTGIGSSTAVPGIALSAPSLDFGNQVVGTTSTSLPLAITNIGLATLNITAIAFTGPFSRILPAFGNCGSSLAPGATCEIDIVFTPTTLGLSSGGQVVITDNAGSGTQVVRLVGTGVSIAAPQIAVVRALDFGDTVIDTPVALPLVIVNSGDAPLIVSAVTLSGSAATLFSVNGAAACATIAADSSCTLNIGFNATSVGAKTAQLTIASNSAPSSPNAAAAPVVVSLTGNGIRAPRPVAKLSLTAMGFGNSIFGGATPNQLVTLTNTGSGPLNITSILAIGDFIPASGCPASLASGASCAINVLFSPLGLGSRSGELQVFSNADGSPHRVQLSGVGCRWFSQSQSRFFLTACGN